MKLNAIFYVHIIICTRKTGHCKSETYEIHVRPMSSIYRYELSTFTTKVRPSSHFCIIQKWDLGTYYFWPAHISMTIFWLIINNNMIIWKFIYYKLCEIFFLLQNNETAVLCTFIIWVLRLCITFHNICKWTSFYFQQLFQWYC